MYAADHTSAKPLAGDAGGQPIIDAVDLVKTYPGGVRALNGVSLGVGSGSILGLLGPNGAGKSTTVKILTTLTRPDSGSAWVAGHDVLRHPDRVRRSIGAVGQRSAVDLHATGRENLVLQGRVHGLGGRELRDRVAALLERFALTDAANRIVQTWSGGMQRKLDVAMGLVHRPAVLFLDEPTTGLDPEARAGLWDEIRRLEADGLAILLTTHYLEEADRLAGNLAIVDEGRIVATGTPETLKAELRGDAIHVELDSPAFASLAAGVLARLDGLGEPSLDGATLSARADRAASAVPSVLAALDGAGIAVASLTVARPSLDDVYLRHTGRTYRPDAASTPRLVEASR
ncbi:MAG: ATP-binding cassette domain-containing protein [Chloroflexi bacterium]|nr:ATP-binding cassette domain-containing protein [Chloroflexota bacterium]